MIDTGLDESSCFFVHDADGDLVPHGYYYDEWGIDIDLSPTVADSGIPSTSSSDQENTTMPSTMSSTTSSTAYQYDFAFTGGDYSAFPERRKVRQLHAQRRTIVERS